jgi:flagellar motor switch protein FliG
MYTFQDLGRLESRSLQKLLMNLDPRTVGLALVGADSTVSRAIFQNISSRTAAVYRDELSYHESADPEDVQKARREVARTLARMVRSGKIADEA